MNTTKQRKLRADEERVMCQFCLSIIGSEHPIDKACPKCHGAGWYVVRTNPHSPVPPSKDTR